MYEFNKIFKKLTQFSEGNNVLDATPSHMDGFLLRDTCIFSTYLNMSIGSKKSLSLPYTPKLQEVFCSKTNSILKVKQCGRCLTF
jgi:hypothetical protein